MFLAVDGVAPRAKMNQQRGRRFRSAREAQDIVRKALLVRREYYAIHNLCETVCFFMQTARMHTCNGTIIHILMDYSGNPDKLVEQVALHLT